MAAISVPGVFDFGGGTLYTGSETVYDVDHTDIWGGSGFGWTTSPTASGVRSGSDDLERDFTFVTSGSITWRVEIANGTYDLEILMADYNYDRLGMNVQIDGAGAVYRTGARQANDEAARVFIPGHVVSGGQIDFVFSFESPGTLALVSGIRITNAAGGKVNLTVPAVIDAGYGDLYTGSETVYAAQLGNWAPNLDGHGFVAAEEAVLSTSRASGSNLEKDFLFVADSANTMTYRLNLANGDYNLEVYIGDTGGSASNVQLYVDGALEDTVSFSSNVQTISFSKTVTSGYIDLTFDSNGAAYCPFVGAKVEAAGGGTEADAAVAPVEAEADVPSLGATGTAIADATVAPASAEADPGTLTATGNAIADAAVAPLEIEVDAPGLAATDGATGTAAVSPVEADAAPGSLAAGGAAIAEASLAPVEGEAEAGGLTATGGTDNDAALSPVGVDVEPGALTPTATGTATASLVPVEAEASAPALAATPDDVVDETSPATPTINQPRTLSRWGCESVYSPMERKLLHLQQRQFQASAVGVVYQRAGHELRICAVPASIEADRETAYDDATIDVESQSWMLWADELRIDGVRVEPERGDLIRRDLPGRDVETWSVHPEPGQPAAVYTDATHLVWLVQTKLFHRRAA